MLLEYYEDGYARQDKSLLALDFADPEEDVVFETGDPEVDEIERRLAAGEDPDVVLADWGEGGKGTKADKTAPTLPPTTSDPSEDEDEIDDSYESDDSDTQDAETSRPLAWQPR